MVSYKKLWKILIDYDMKKADLRKTTGIITNTLAKLSKNELVAIEILVKNCKFFNCDIGDIMGIVDEKKRWYIL